ncbi:MAG TPA: autotransporter outer membrane beta-barrel domain-containing protein [Candidatus Megaira endosymbiont of Nemacystus decipiens]|nr:autotransporter outer membrane beta-barrel domain-containing protein [Candidatus Megaera endosymbiont of Nemacystus decipiens]
MKKEKRNRILATASALAVITSAASAQGALFSSTGGSVTLENGVNTLNSTGVATPWTPGDSFRSDTNDSISFGNAAGDGVTVGTYDSNNQGVISLVMSKDSSIGSIINSTGSDGSTMTVNNDIEFTASGANGLNGAGNTQVGGDFSGLSGVTLGSGGGGAELSIGADSVFTGTVDSDANEDGVIQVSGGAEATFGSDVGALQSIGSFVVADGSTANFQGNATSSEFELDGTNSRINVSNGKSINGTIDGENNFNGRLNFLQDGSATGAIGSSEALKEVIVGTGAASFDSTVATETLSIGSGSANLSDNLTGNTNFTADGTLNVANGVAVDGAITTNTNNTGNVVFAADGSVSKALGTSTNALKKVELTGTGTVQLNNASATSHYASNFLFKDNDAVLELAADHSINGTLSADADGNGQVTFLAGGSVNGTIGTTTNKIGSVESQTAAVNIASGDHHVANGFKVANAAEAGFTFADGANINGNVVTAGANGKLVFAGNSTLTGEAGSIGNELASVSIDGGNDKKVTFNGVVNSTNTTITNGATVELGANGGVQGGPLTIGANGGSLLITGDTNHDVSNVSIVDHGDNKANIEVSGAIGTSGAFNVALGQVGDNTVPEQFLDLLKVNANNTNTTTVQLEDGSHVKNIELHNSNSVVEFSAGAPGTYRIGGIAPQSDKFGEMKISDDSTFEAASDGSTVNFGSKDQKLKNLNFAGDFSLSLGDKHNIYTDAVTNNASEGVIDFSGTHEFYGKNTNPLSEIVLQNDSNVTLMTEVNADDVTLNNGSVINTANRIFAANGINGAGVGEGKLRLTNTDPLEIASDIGSTNLVNQIEFAGGDVSVAAGKTVLAQEFAFSGDAASRFTLDDQTASYTAKFINNSPEGITNTIVLNPAIATTEFAAGSTIATEDSGAKKLNVQMGDGVNAKISTTSIEGAIFTTSVVGKGDLELNADGVILNSIGSSEQRIGALTVTDNATITDGIYTTDMSIAAGKTSTMGGTINPTNGITLGAASNAVFSDGAIIDAEINGAGNVSMNASGSLKQPIGSTTPVTSLVFSSDDTTNFVVETDSITADSVAFNQGGVDFNDDTTITSKVTMTASDIDIGASKVTMDGDVSVSGANEISFNDHATDGNGQINITVGGGLTVDPNTTVAVDVNDLAASRIVDGSTREIDVILNDGASVSKFDPTKISIVNSNLFLKYNAVSSNGLRIEATDNTTAAVELLSNNLNATDSANLTKLAAAPAGSKASGIVDILATLSDGEGGFLPQATEAVQRLNPLNNDKVNLNTLMSVTTSLSTRLNSQLVNNAGVVASGDHEALYGLWAVPFASTTKQKEDGSFSGYKAETYGGTVGADAKVNEDLVLGAAFTAANSEVKYRDFKRGDKSDIDTLAFSLYGKQQLNNKWFMNSFVTFANNDVDVRENRVTGPTTYETVRGKYDSMMFMAEAMFGYNTQMHGMSLTPMMGVRYTRINDSGYTETGAVSTANLTVHNKAFNRLEAVLGAQVNGGSYYFNNCMVMPEMHASVSHDIIDRSRNSFFNIDGVNGSLNSRNSDLNRTVFNVGFSLNSENGMMEYGIGYDANLAKKNVAHQGTLKLRINF